jgi:hypothetical protein
MLLLADTHVHLYDCYDLDACFASAFANLVRLDPRAAAGAGPADTIKLLCLAERRGCRVFRQLRDRANGLRLSRHVIEDGPGPGVLVVRNQAGDRLHVAAGRQVATRERLEVLALTVDLEVTDGGDILDTIGRIEAGGALPVLPWAPGKWTGHRAKVVRSVLNSAPPDRLFVGDTSMRPHGWPTPRLMREAAERGFAVLAGTDPLPFKGQEAAIGRYGIVADGAFDSLTPADTLRMLRRRGLASVAGRRDSAFSVAARLVRLRLAK